MGSSFLITMKTVKSHSNKRNQVVRRWSQSNCFKMHWLIYLFTLHFEILIIYYQSRVQVIEHGMLKTKFKRVWITEWPFSLKWMLHTEKYQYFKLTRLDQYIFNAKVNDWSCWTNISTNPVGRLHPHFISTRRKNVLIWLEVCTSLKSGSYFLQMWMQHKF